MSQPLRWGILGTGNIARQFAAGMAGSKRGVLRAAGSRDAAKAQAFAQAHGVPAAHGSYGAVLDDPQVDAVYISLPNSMHCEWTLKALAAGKHVLCEKPLASNEAEVRRMFDAAKAANRLLVEAFMYRSHPLLKAVRSEVAAGTIGEVRMIRASFCFRLINTEGNARFSSELAGGGIMDVGCYCVDFIRQFAGPAPRAVHAVARLHASGVDDMAAGVLLFPGGAVGSFTCGMAMQADNAACISGTEGYIEIPVPWKPPVQGARYAIVRGTPPKMEKATAVKGPSREERTVDADRPLYALEADDFAAAVQDGAPPAISGDESIGNMLVLDQLRRQAGLAY
jgi:predicted dehydrogenase